MVWSVVLGSEKLRGGSNVLFAGFVKSRFLIFALTHNLL